MLITCSPNWFLVYLSVSLSSLAQWVIIYIHVSISGRRLQSSPFKLLGLKSEFISTYACCSILRVCSDIHLLLTFSFNEANLKVVYKKIWKLANNKTDETKQMKIDDLKKELWKDILR